MNCSGIFSFMYLVVHVTKRNGFKHLIINEKVLLFLLLEIIFI